MSDLREMGTEELQAALASAVERLNPGARKADLDKCGRAYRQFEDTGKADEVRINVEVDGLAFLMLTMFWRELERRRGD